MKADSHTEILDKIQSLIESNQLSFLIGAGFSKNINKDAFPSWRELLEDAIWKKYGTGRDSDRVKEGKLVCDKVLRSKSLLDIASDVVSDVGYHEAIDDYIESHTPYLVRSGDRDILMKDDVELSDNVNPECHNLLKQLDVRNIYTFNYDNALEYFLGDKKDLQRSKDALIREKEKLSLSIKELDDKAHSQEKSQSADVSEDEPNRYVLSIEDGHGINKSTENDEDNRKRKELNSDINDKKHEIEKKEKEIDEAYLVVKKSADIALTSAGHNIYKIHGSLRLQGDTQYGFDGDKHAQYVITKEDYATYVDKHSAFVNLMRIDLLRNRFCIIGVSGTDANFLAWINWVKDVLDNNDSEEQIKSFYIHSGNDDLSRDMRQMLENHYITPVILKDCFPEADNDSERVKAFLEYVQPNNTIRSEKLTAMWRALDDNVGWKLDKTGKVRKSVNVRKTVRESFDIDEFCRLSSIIVFHKSLNIVHSASKEMRLAPIQQRKDGLSLQQQKIYASAIRCSLLPFTTSKEMECLSVLSKSRNAFIKETSQYARRRHYLLTEPKSLKDAMIGNDDYSRLMKRLFLFDFPQSSECQFECKTGLDYVRLYSLQVFLSQIPSIKIDDYIRTFASPQELVLASDWLLWMNSTAKFSIHSLAKQYMRKYVAFRLSDYIQSYMREMRERKGVSTYGDVSDIIYLDGRKAGFENAAVLLNSLIELGVTFAGHNVLTDDDWIAIARELKSYYPYPIAFYTIARDSKDVVIKRIVQEMMYDEASYAVLPDLLKRLITSLGANNTPKYLLAPIARFAKELLVAVPVGKWRQSFTNIVEICLNNALNSNYPTPVALYQFLSEGIKYISEKDVKLRVLRFVLDNLTKDIKYDNDLNVLAISARDGLTARDFEPLAERLVQYGDKDIKQIESYVLINLSHLLSKNNQQLIYSVLEKKSLKDVNLVEAYSDLIKGNDTISAAYKQKLVSRDNIWQVRVEDDRIMSGRGYIKFSKVDDILHFNQKQVIAIFEGLKKALSSLKNLFDNPKHDVKDNGWQSAENNYRELVVDMRLFVRHHREDLSNQESFGSVCEDLEYVYKKCLFGKTILQMLADDKIYRAIRSIMTQTELGGIQTLVSEYEMLLGIILTRNSEDIGTGFKHISWAVRNYKEFFNTEQFNKLLFSILDSYEQFFTTENPHRWDVLGCEKETAEMHLCSLAKTLSERGYSHPFWSGYKKRFYLR